MVYFKIWLGLKRWSISKFDWASLVAQLVQNPSAIQETWVWSVGWEDPLEKGTATHSSILAWRIPWTEEIGGLQSTHGQSWTQLRNFHSLISKYFMVLYHLAAVAAAAKSLQPGLTLCDPTDGNLPGSSGQGILQARILECVAVPFPRESSQPRDGTEVSHIAGEFFTIWNTREACLKYIIYITQHSVLQILLIPISFLVFVLLTFNRDEIDSCVESNKRKDWDLAV